MLRRYRLMILIGTSLALFLTLAGCGLNNRGTAGSPADSAGTVLPLSPRSNVFVSTDGVLLRIDGLPPSGGNPISITLLNRSNQTLVFPDHLTACSTILLQVMPSGGGSGQWQEVAPCRRAPSVERAARGAGDAPRGAQPTPAHRHGAALSAGLDRGGDR